MSFLKSVVDYYSGKESELMKNEIPLKLKIKEESISEIGKRPPSYGLHHLKISGDLIDTNQISLKNGIKSPNNSEMTQNQMRDYIKHMESVFSNKAIYSEENKVSVVGLPLHSSLSKSNDLPNPMFLIGHTYKQINKDVVLIVGMSNQNTSDETVYSLDNLGKTIHRYNRRNFGVVTGTELETLDPRNLQPME